MRSNYMIRSLMITVAAGMFAAAPSYALKIASPTEGQRVRDKVAIIISKSSLPLSVLRSGFIAIKIDGRFTAAISGATAAASGENEPATPNMVYVWDTKQPIDDPLVPQDQRYYRDGKHEITIEAHGIEGTSAKDVIAEKTSINVSLQNQIPQRSPAPPLVLKYRYMMGQESLYKVSVTGELLDSTGYSLTGGQIPILAQFTVAQSVEDLQSGGSALLRYRVQKNAFTRLFGQVNMLDQTQPPFRSVYKIVDNLGAVIEDNVLSDRTIIEVTDCLIRLPGRKVQVGESWPTADRIRLEGLSDLATFSGTSTLAGLEWESGYECAKIVSDLKGSPSLRIIPQMAINDQISATNKAYFAYKQGKLIKDVTLMEFDMTLDSETLASIQQQMPQPGSSGVDGASDQNSQMSGMPGGSPSYYSSGGTPSLSRAGAGMPGSYSPSPSGGSPYGDSAGRRTSVRMRLVITKELVK